MRNTVNYKYICFLQKIENFFLQNIKGIIHIMQRNELTEMTKTMRYEDRDSLYEIVTSDEFPVEYDLFTRNLNDLVDAEFVIRSINESQDQVWYTGKPGLKYADFSSIDSPLKQQILLQFVENPATFFVLFNTQKGKAAIVQKKIMEWAREQRKQIVAILMLDNDTTLGDQTTESLVARMKKEGVTVKLFPLVSTSKTSIDEILTYIDAYAGNPGEEGYPMPLITALTNPKQLEKVLRILKKVLTRNRQRYPNLHYAMIWDEADKTYPLVRDKIVQIEGIPTCIRQFTLDDTTALHGNGIVTATEGALLEGDYPECSSAHAFIPEMNEQDEQHYRAFHHPEAVIKCVQIIRKIKNNQSFLDVFNKNKEHFMTPIVLKNGEMGFRKTIVNSSAQGHEMTKLAKIMNGEKCHTMVFNQTGLTVYNCEHSSSAPIRFKTKGRSFNELLFYAYKKCRLDTAPLLILGRRKIDRGLGFHYAPRSHREIVPKLLDFEMGPLQTDGIEGLIWTDEFLGHVEIKETAVQKAGRGAGIVAQCPQYPNHLTWWTDEETAAVVKRHYEIVDAANNLGGCRTMVQALEYAKQEVAKTDVPKPEASAAIKMYRIYDNEEVVKKVCKHLDYTYRKTDENANGFKETSLNTKRSVVSLEEAVKKVTVGYGTNNGERTFRTYYPCYVNTTDSTTLRFVVIIRPVVDDDVEKHKEKERDKKLKEVDENYPSL